MAVSAAVLAHQGGWDEALLIATPVIVLTILLGVAIGRGPR